jgi:hypothetical protein
LPRQSRSVHFGYNEQAGDGAARSYLGGSGF